MINLSEWSINHEHIAFSVLNYNIYEIFSLYAWINSLIEIVQNIAYKQQRK